MKAWTAAALAFSLSVSTAMAAEANAPLASGKPAGVKAAQGMDNHNILLFGGLAIAGAGIALAVSGGNNNANTPSTAPVTTGTAG